MNKLLRIFTLLTAVAIITTSLTACGEKKISSEVVPTEEVKKSVTVKLVLASMESEYTYWNDLKKSVLEKTGQNVELVPIPGSPAELQTKLDIMAMSGDQSDLFNISAAGQYFKFAKNNFLEPLEELSKGSNYDLEKVFGQYLTKVNSKVFGLPSYQSVWAVYYNKNMFDAAGIPYPKGAWTWSKYKEIAKKLTDSSKGTYGSLMLDYDVYSFFSARQKGVEGYKPDGTSNYDNQEFKDSLKFFADLGNVDKIQPGLIEYKLKKMNANSFLSGKFGMMYVSSFMISTLSDKVKNPREFKVGITEAPTPDGFTGKASNMVSTNIISLNVNSQNKKEAFEVLKYLAENLTKYSNNLPAKNLSEAEATTLTKTLADQTGGELSAEDISNALYNKKVNLVSEKLIGGAAAVYTNTIKQETELYCAGQKSLDDAIKTIKQKVDAAIVDENKNTGK